MTPMELFLLINHDRKYLYYDVYDLCFTDSDINRREFEKYLLSRKKGIEMKYPKSNIMLPTFKEIDHKSIMSFYVKSCVIEGDIRKQLFYILIRYDYVVPFIDKLKELGLYEEFEDCCGSIYNQIIEERSEKYSVTL